MKYSAFDTPHKPPRIWKTWSMQRKIRLNAHIYFIRNISLKTWRQEKKKTKFNFWAWHFVFSAHSSILNRKIKSALFLRMSFWRFFLPWSLWIINKLISLYSSIFGDLSAHSDAQGRDRVLVPTALALSGDAGLEVSPSPWYQSWTWLGILDHF